MPRYYIYYNMAKLPIRPPRINVSSLKGSFWKQLGMIILATTISLFFTILTTQLLEKRQFGHGRLIAQTPNAGKTLNMAIPNRGTSDFRGQHHHVLAFHLALAEVGKCLCQRTAEGERVNLGYFLGD